MNGGIINTNEKTFRDRGSGFVVEWRQLILGLLIIIILAILLAPIVAILIGGFFGASVSFFSAIFNFVVVIVIGSLLLGFGLAIIDLAADHYLYILPAIVTLLATVFYFKKKEIKKFYTTIENNLKIKVGKITENFILRTIIVILMILMFYLVIK